MKIRKIEGVSQYIGLDESNFTPKQLKQHVRDHHNQYLGDPRFKGLDPESQEFANKYDYIGNSLSWKMVGPSMSYTDRYIGYIDKEGGNVKYDTLTGDYVVYFGKNTATLHKKTRTEYNHIRKRDFKKEYPYNENKTIPNGSVQGKQP